SLRYDKDPDSQTVAALSHGLNLSTTAAFSFGAVNFGSTPGVDIAQGSTFSVRLTGTPHNDHIAFKYQGTLNGILNYTADGRAGSDRINSVINADANSSGTVHARVLGGPGDDPFLRLAITEPLGVTGLQPGRLTVDGLIDGGPGKNHGDRTLNVLERNIQSDTLESPYTPAQ